MTFRHADKYRGWSTRRRRWTLAKIWMMSTFSIIWMVRGPRDENVLSTGVCSPFRQCNVSQRRRIPRRSCICPYTPYYIRIQIYIWPLISDLDLEIWVKFSRSSQSGHILLNCDTNECFKFSGQSDFRTSFCIVYAFFQERIKTKLSKCMHPYSDDGEPRLGIEPSSPAWQAGILTDILTWL